MAPRDYMHSSNRHYASSMWTAPGGLNTGNQLVDIGGALALQMALGQETFNNMRPMSKVGVSDLDYTRSRSRMQQMQGSPDAGGTTLEQRIYNQNLPYLAPRSGFAAGNSFAQRIYDTLNQGGSQMGAFQTLYTGVGSRMGGGEAGRSLGAERALEQMNAHFMSTSGFDKGGLDYKKSYGFNRVEIAEQIDAGSRYGIAGMSQSKFARAVKDGRGGEMMEESARVFSAAQGVFGKDKSMEELSQLMTRSIDGFQGMDANKATDLLHKIQATSRAVGISTEAFSEYSEMLNQIYKSVGAGGASASGHIMNSAMAASAATEVGRSTGDAQLGDMSKNMDAMGRNTLDAVNSPALRRAQAFGSIYANLSNEQRIGIGVKGVGSLAEMKGQIQNAIDTGDGNRLVELLDSFDKNIDDNNIIGKNASSNRARNLSDRDRDDSSRFLDLKGAGALNAEAMKRDMAKQLSLKGLDASIVAKMGGEKGLYSMLDKLGSFEAIGSRDQVLDALNNSKAGLNLSDDEKSLMASQFANQARGLTNNVNYQRTFGFQSNLDANVGFASGSRAGREQLGRDEKSVSSDVIQQKLMAGISGDALRPFKMGEEATKLILGVMGDIESGRLNKNLVTNENGEFDMGKLNEYTKGKFGDVFKNNSFAAFKRITAETADNEGFEKEVNQAYKDEFSKSGDKTKATKAADDVIQKRAMELKKRLDKESDAAADAGKNRDNASNSAKSAVTGAAAVGGDGAAIGQGVAAALKEALAPALEKVPGTLANIEASLKELVSRTPVIGGPGGSNPPVKAKRKGDE